MREHARTPSLSDLIVHVEQSAASDDALALLETAAQTAHELTERSDQLLSHFVDRCRRAGHSWAEIGTALGVTKQAVQKRFTAAAIARDPSSLDRFTDRARRVVSHHAQAAADELAHNFIGTEHLLLAMYAERGCIAEKALKRLGLDRGAAYAAVEARVARGHQGLGGTTPRAWAALENTLRIALRWGHNYIGTEHILMALLDGVGGVAEAVLKDHGITKDKLEPELLSLLPKR